MADVSQLTPAVAEPAAGAAAAAHAGPRRFFARLVREQPLGTAGGIVILLLVLVSIFADSLAPYRYEEIHLRDRLQAPSTAYLLGTDHIGRDLLSRLIHGARLSLTVGLAATVLTVVVAVLIGGTTGFIGGRLDLVTQRFVDAWMAFPGLLLLLTIMSIAGRGMLQIIVVLGVSGGIPASRVVRGAVAGGEGERVLPGGAGDRQLAPALAAAPRAAQHRGADHHHLQHQRRWRDHVGGGAELPGLRPAAGHPELGRHAEPRGTPVHGDGAPSGAVAGAVPDRGGVQPQHVRRRGARPPGPPPARPPRALRRRPGRIVADPERMGQKRQTKRRLWGAGCWKWACATTRSCVWQRAAASAASDA